jgi:hypothetical protein
MLARRVAQHGRAAAPLAAKPILTTFSTDGRTNGLKVGARTGRQQQGVLDSPPPSSSAARLESRCACCVINSEGCVVRLSLCGGGAHHYAGAAGALGYAHHSQTCGFSLPSNPHPSLPCLQLPLLPLPHTASYNIYCPPHSSSTQYTLITTIVHLYTPLCCIIIHDISYLFNYSTTHTLVSRSSASILDEWPG